jgi:hypothetical protein
VEYWGLQGAEGSLHLLSGWVIFASSLAIIFLLHRLLQGFFPGGQEPGEQEKYA